MVLRLEKYDKIHQVLLKLDKNLQRYSRNTDNIRCIKAGETQDISISYVSVALWLRRAHDLKIPS